MKKKKNTRKIKYKSVIIVAVILIIIAIIVYSFLGIRLTNIYISGNEYIKDQDIIEYLGIEDYPTMINVRSSSLKKTLSKNILIKSSKINRVGLSGINIEIEENYPLFFDKNKDKTVLLDGRTTNHLEAPTLINYVPDKKYELLIQKLSLVDRKILSKVSEIEYAPNEVDDELFLLRMNDGNYVYITLIKIKSLNEYVTIIKNFKGKKGILYLDSGEYFKVLGEG
ncbi:MAG: FtsQ-type POTRA domain-containing protein [Bacilli bacterium]|nr:FtsQ-type POTRA domain-containing protein [Bacilli bacterium]